MIDDLEFPSLDYDPATDGDFRLWHARVGNAAKQAYQQWVREHGENVQAYMRLSVWSADHSEAYFRGVSKWPR